LSALDILERFTPDLILSDIRMPRMDGREFYQAVRKDSRLVAIPFIFVTSYASSEEIQAGREMGVEDYLTKPIDLDKMVRIVNARLLRAAEIQFNYLDRAYLETVNVLANTIEGRDPYTRGHVDRVATYAQWLAEELSWPDSNVRTLEYGARLHDIGKIIIPDQILNKREALTPVEWVLMKQHTTAGAGILRSISHLQKIIPYVLYHHERWDGSGYPDGLRGLEIPIEGRLLAIVDVYDALTTNRIYRPKLTPFESISFLELRAGIQFDPDLTAAFIRVLKKRTLTQLTTYQH
jgi:putative two-component system response regulator